MCLFTRVTDAPIINGGMSPVVLLNSVISSAIDCVGAFPDMIKNDKKKERVRKDN